MKVSAKSNACPICTQPVKEKPCMARCGHQFHFACVCESAIKSVGDAPLTCAICKTELAVLAPLPPKPACWHEIYSSLSSSLTAC